MKKDNGQWDRIESMGQGRDGFNMAVAFQASLYRDLSQAGQCMSLAGRCWQLGDSCCELWLTGKHPVRNSWVPRTRWTEWPSDQDFCLGL